MHLSQHSKFGYFFLLVFQLVFFSNLKAQTLTQDLQIISQTNDLMGGVVLAFCSDEIIESIPFGKADLERGISVSDSTLFRVASISKSITAMAVMKLYEDGLLNLDTDVSEYLDFPLVNPAHPQKAITARMLLSHTSSIIDGAGYGSFLGATYNNNPIPPISELLMSSGSYFTSDIFNNTQPGTYFNYSNLNFGILGTLIEAVSGLRFDEYCRINILEPLGVKGSFNVNNIENIDNVSVLYRKINGSWTPQADNYQGVQPVFTNLDSYTVGSNGLRFAPQGGLRVSGPDLATLFQLFLNGGSSSNGVEILKPSTISQMLETEWLYDGSNGNNYYGLFNSWGLGLHKSTNTANQDIVLESNTPMIGHPGEAYGLVSDAYVDLEDQHGLIVIINGNGVGYSTGNTSVFYTVEKQIFDAINTYGFEQYCNVVQTKNIMSSDLKVYPNPVDSVLVIEHMRTVESSKAAIFDVSGNLIQNVFVRNGVLSELQDLSIGIYVLEIIETGQLIRFIKK
jgi:CubicO group peptidase (beta-lactamase class C family)